MAAQAAIFFRIQSGREGNGIWPAVTGPAFYSRFSRSAKAADFTCPSSRKMTKYEANFSPKTSSQRHHGRFQWHHRPPTRNIIPRCWTGKTCLFQRQKLITKRVVTICDIWRYFIHNQQWLSACILQCNLIQSNPDESSAMVLTKDDGIKTITRSEDVFSEIKEAAGSIPTAWNPFFWKPSFTGGLHFLVNWNQLNYSKINWD